MSHPDSSHSHVPLSTMILAVRPWSFTMTAISVTVGALLALEQSGFAPWLYLLTLVGMILVHGATNLINDVYDVRSGVDQPDAPTARYRPHPLVEGVLSARQLWWASMALYGLAGLIGIYLLILRGWPVALIAAIGGVASFTYTADPIAYKHRGLGELSVFLMWGPLMMLGAYFVQTGGWAGAADVLWASLPIGLWVALVLLANNLKDIDYDRRLSISTLGTMSGKAGALRLFTALVALDYLLVILGAIFGALPLWTLLVIASLPQAYIHLRHLWQAHEIPADADPRTAQLSMRFGLLLIAGLVIAHWIPV